MFERNIIHVKYDTLRLLEQEKQKKSKAVKETYKIQVIYFVTKLINKTNLLSRAGWTSGF